MPSILIVKKKRVTGSQAVEEGALSHRETNKHTQIDINTECYQLHLLRKPGWNTHKETILHAYQV